MALEKEIPETKEKYTYTKKKKKKQKYTKSQTMLYFHFCCCEEKGLFQLALLGFSQDGNFKQLSISPLQGSSLACC